MPSYAEKGFATYIHNGTAWVELNSTSATTGNNIYVRTSGTGTVDTNRILDVSIHNGTTWVKSYEAYVPTPPPKPAAPTISTDTGWDTRVDTTKVKWTRISGVTGYTLLVTDQYGVEISRTNYAQPSSGTTVSSGNISIAPDGIATRFSVTAYTTSVDGLTSVSDSSKTLQITSGLYAQRFTVTSPFSTWFFTKTANSTGCNSGNTYSVSKTGNGTDINVKGYCVVDYVAYTIAPADGNGSVSLASNSRSITFAGPQINNAYTVANYGGIQTVYYTSPSGYLQPGGGTYTMSAVGVGATNGWATTSGSGTTCSVTGGTTTTATYTGRNLTIAGYETKGNSSALI